MAEIFCPRCENPMLFLTAHPPVDDKGKPMLDALPVALTFGCASCNATVTVGTDEAPLYDLDFLNRFHSQTNKGGDE